jgi:hypothetical protein
MGKSNRDIATGRSGHVGSGPMRASIDRPRVGAIRETYVNKTEGHHFGERVRRDPPSADPGALFRACRSEYGRCVSRIYVDTDDGPKACGWVFQRRERYEDSEETYLREVWVELLAKPDTVVVHRLHLGDAP